MQGCHPLVKNKIINSHSRLSFMQWKISEEDDPSPRGGINENVNVETSSKVLNIINNINQTEKSEMAQNNWN